jgi:hypothetical protein
MARKSLENLRVCPSLGSPKDKNSRNLPMQDRTKLHRAIIVQLKMLKLMFNKLEKAKISE